MRKALVALATTAVFGLGWTSGQVFSQDKEEEGKPKPPEEGAPPAMSEEDMKEMEAMMKAGTPTEPHKKMAAMDGEWVVTGKMWMAPDKPAMEFTGTAKNRMLFDGRYQVQEFDSAFMGMPFQGFGVTGYDNMTKEYVSIWLDSMSTAVMVSRGKADESGQPTYVGEFVDGMGRKQVMRMKEKLVDKDTMNFEAWNKSPKFPDEFKSMEMTYKRKK
ncbi:MAG TPA: DUF1579 domain-containing protein [Planctomycetota bacterium]|nr:DUF1579 domain-containing protein [Planctomycetota bacterium]